MVDRIYNEIKSNKGNVRATLNIKLENYNKIIFNFLGTNIAIRKYWRTTDFWERDISTYEMWIKDKLINASNSNIRKLYNLLDKIRFDDIFEVDDDEQFENIDESFDIILEKYEENDDLTELLQRIKRNFDYNKLQSDLLQTRRGWDEESKINNVTYGTLRYDRRLSVYKRAIQRKKYLIGFKYKISYSVEFEGERLDVSQSVASSVWNYLYYKHINREKEQRAERERIQKQRQEEERIRQEQIRLDKINLRKSKMKSFIEEEDDEQFEKDDD